LTAVLPPRHVFHVPGGHTWEPWRQLLRLFLRDSEFAVRCTR
jgi:enterochelin esterase-like enzyme